VDVVDLLGKLADEEMRLQPCRSDGWIEVEAERRPVLELLQELLAV